MAKSKTLKVEYSPPGKNKGSRRISVSFERGAWEPNDMEALLVNAQLRIVFTADPNSGKDVDGQETMECAHGDYGPLEVIADVKRIKLGAPRCSFGMTIPLDTDVTHLDWLAFKNGKLKITRIGDAKSGDDEPEEE